MYNATSNNDYDSYPTPEEYKTMMVKLGQKNYTYAGGEFKRGIPMRSQIPIYNDWKDNNIKRKTFGTLNESNFINNNTNYLMMAKNPNKNSNMSGLQSWTSTGYYKTENNYTNSQKEKYNLTKVPENI